MISEIRDYFKTNLEKFSLKENKEAFDPTMSANEINESFFLSYAVEGIQDFGTHYEDTNAIELRVYKKGYRKTQEAYDAIYDLGHSIRSEITNKTNIATFNFEKFAPIATIVPTSLEVIALDSNDNTMYASIKFSAKRFYSYCT